MEENVKPVEVPVETTTTTSTVAAPVASNRSKLPLIILAVVALAALATAAFLILTNKQGTVVNTMPAGSGLNVRDPQAATAKLNQAFPAYYSLIADSAAGGDFSKSLSTLGADSVEGLLLKMTVDTAVGDQAFEVVLDAKTNQTQTEGSVGIKGKVEGFGEMDINAKFAAVTPEETYFQLNGLPAEAGLLLTQIGLTQEKWYKIPAELMEGSQDLGESITDGSGLEAFADIQAKLDGKALFINPKSVPARTVFGVNLDCMTVEINPELDVDVELDSLEICNNDTLLPIYIGFSATQDGVPMTLGLEMAQTSNFTVVAPEGAVEATFLTELFNSFLGGSSGDTMPNVDEMMLEDGSGLTPEELEEYENLMDSYYR